MGVNHLKRDAAAVNRGDFHPPTGRSRQSLDVSLGADARRPASTSGSTSVPEVPAVNAMGENITHPGNSAPQPPHDGGPAGAKGSLGKMGAMSGNKKGMSGGSMGGPVGV